MRLSPQLWSIHSGKINGDLDVTCNPLKSTHYEKVLAIGLCKALEGFVLQKR